MKSFISSVPRHSFSKLFQLPTGHGVLGKYFWIRKINERNHNCEFGQLETVKQLPNECSLHSAKRDMLRKVSWELDIILFLGNKRLRVEVRFLETLPQLCC